MPSDPQNEEGELGRFREYLLLLVRLQVDQRFQSKIDLSGVVQQTLLDAHQAWDRIRDLSADEKAAWLRKALANNLIDEVRKLTAATRDVNREQSLKQAFEESSARLEAVLATDKFSPEQRALRNERLLQLAEALAQLPEAQRTAVELHHLKDWPLAEVGRHMGRSKGAVAQLVFRGLQTLRDLLAEKKED